MKAVISTATLTLLASGAWSAEGNPSGAPEAWGSPVMSDQPFSMLLVDRLEYGDSSDGDSRLWDAQARHGGDYRKLWLKTEGEGPTGKSVEAAEVQALYDRLFAPFWSWQAGVRHDVRPSERDVSYVVAGLQGLAPQRFETDLALFLSEHGDLSLRAEFEYDLLITQRLVLQPRLELNASAEHVPERGLGRGLNDTEMGLRLRYEIRRELAPYIGVRWERRYGDTRDMARGAGEPISTTAFLIGLRLWY